MSRRLIFPLLLGIVGCAILIGLGTWQMQRLGWKQDILAGIEARLAAPPVALPDAPDPEADSYLTVAVDGAYLPGELHVLTSIKGTGPGFRVIAPFETADGRRILVDRGYIGETEKNLARAPGPATIAGNLVWPDDRTSSTPDPDLGRNIWFARDVGPMAEALGTDPLMVILRDAAAGEGAPLPQPVDTSTIPNDHLQYAITWFALAAVWAGMTAFLIRRITRPGG